MDRVSNILDFYVKSNANKYNIVIDGERGISVAEKTVLECIAALAIYSEYELDFDLNTTIKMLMAMTMINDMDNMKKSDYYDGLISEYFGDITTVEGYVARICSNIVNNLDSKIIDSNKVYEFLKKYNKLQKLERSGHNYWGVNSDRVESVLEHIYGTMILAMGLDSELNYAVDFNKVLEMLLIHETEEVIIGDITEWDGISKEEKAKIGKEASDKLFSDLRYGKKFVMLLDEFNKKSTIESEYAYLCDKLEYDLQVKMYDEMGKYDFDNLPSNVVTESDEVKNLLDSGINSVFGIHYEYDKSKYTRFPSMRLILENAKNRK